VATVAVLQFLRYVTVVLLAPAIAAWILG
jgi:hypothetical protein